MSDSKWPPNQHFELGALSWGIVRGRGSVPRRLRVDGATPMPSALQIMDLKERARGRPRFRAWGRREAANQPYVDHVLGEAANNSNEMTVLYEEKGIYNFYLER